MTDQCEMEARAKACLPACMEGGREGGKEELGQKSDGNGRERNLVEREGEARKKGSKSVWPQPSVRPSVQESGGQAERKRAS